MLTPVALNWLGPYLAAIPITAIGLVVGLGIGGWMVSGRVTFFFVDDFTTLIMGVFFGVIGFTIFATRGRLLSAQAKLAEAELAATQQDKVLAETELKLLQAQIEPHFLFNTLSNVSSMIHSDPHGAEKTLLNLTTLLRNSLSRTRSGTVTVAQEMEIARAYLEIQRTRMRDRLAYDLDVDPAAQALPLPPLLVQPLIENAIKHGIDPLEEGGHISVRISRNTNLLTIEVRDDGCGIQESGNTSSGTGLTNVRKRIKQIYPRNEDGAGGKLTLNENKPRGVVATIEIPLESA